jgi:SAM-dependent methyltransferase
VIVRARSSISPSKSLLRFADEIASGGARPVLDAPCGNGRNAIPIAVRGCTVVGVDNDRKRLTALEESKASFIAEHIISGVEPGRIFTVCADLEPESWPFKQSSFSAVICIHFPIVNLVPCFFYSLQSKGHIYIETFGGHGGNFLQLPKAGQLREMIADHADIKFYKEQKVGSHGVDAATVTVFAQKR